MGKLEIFRSRLGLGPFAAFDTSGKAAAVRGGEEGGGWEEDLRRK